MDTMEPAVSDVCVRVPWGEIKGKAWGPESGRPVLCLHGWADNCGTFKTLIPLLPKECRYVAVDMPGHGFSSHRPPGVFYSFSTYVADVRRVVEDLQWTKFSIMGHSMGGNISGMFSALFPEMVEAVILLDAFGFIPTDSGEISKIMRQGIEEMIQYEKTKDKPPKVYTYEKAVERLQTANPPLSEYSVHILLERGLVQVEGGFAFSRDLRVNFRNIDRITLERSLELQSRIQAPILIILAKGPRGFANFQGSKYKEFFSTLLQGYRDKNHTVVTVDGDHHVHLNNPETVSTLVSDFLQTKVISQ